MMTRPAEAVVIYVCRDMPCLHFLVMLYVLNVYYSRTKQYNTKAVEG